MLNGNVYEYNQQSQSFEQHLKQNYRNTNNNNNNNNNNNDNREYYHPIGKIPSPTSFLRRNKSFKSILKKLQNAILQGNFEKVQYFVENYGIVNETEHSLHGGRTGLMLSITKDNYEMIDYFLQLANIDLDARGKYYIFFLFFFFFF